MVKSAPAQRAKRLDRPPLVRKYMTVQLHIIKSGGRLEKHRKTIEAVFLNTVSKISTKLPLSEVYTVVADDPMGTIPEIGICGRALNTHLVSVSLDPASEYLKNNFAGILESALAHELHHCMRWRNLGREQTLLEAMIAEGLADDFAAEITGGFLPAWANILTEAQLKTFGEKAKEEYDRSGYDHALWFFGSRDREVPRWTGYALGFDLVKKYRAANPGETHARLYNLPAKDFIRN